MIRLLRFQALLALAFLLLSSTFLSNPILELKDRVLLNNNTTIFAVDIVKNLDFKIPETLYRLVVAYIPINVSYMELDAQVVANLIKQNLKGYEVIPSSEKIRIYRQKKDERMQLMSLNNIIKDFETSMREKYGEDVSIEWLTLDSTPSNDLRFIYSYSEVGNGYFNIFLKEISNGKVTAIKNLRAQLKLLRTIVVAKRKINYGEIIQEGDVELKKYNIFGKNMEFLENTEEVIGKRSKRNFNPGDPIIETYLEVPPYVVKGQVVSAYVSINGIVVTTFVRLMEDGNIGEVVSARNVDTGKLIYGVIEEGPRLRILVGKEETKE